MIRELKRFWQDESGPELVEWAVVTVILILATYVILGQIGDELGAIYQRIREVLQQVRSR